VTQLDYQLII